MVPDVAPYPKYLRSSPIISSVHFRMFLHSRRCIQDCDRRHSMIRKLQSGEYRLYSRKKDAKSGKRRNLGTFKTKSAAHEKAVQYFMGRLPTAEIVHPVFAVFSPSPVSPPKTRVPDPCLRCQMQSLGPALLLQIRSQTRSSWCALQLPILRRPC